MLTKDGEFTSSHAACLVLTFIWLCLLGRKKVEYNCPVRNKEGILLMNEEEQMNRWQQHFKEILNRKTNQYIHEIK
jgi:hypothetical protein